MDTQKLDPAAPTTPDTKVSSPAGTPASRRYIERLVKESGLVVEENVEELTNLLSMNMTLTKDRCSVPDCKRGVHTDKETQVELPYCYQHRKHGSGSKKSKRLCTVPVIVKNGDEQLEVACGRACHDDQSDYCFRHRNKGSPMQSKCMAVKADGKQCQNTSKFGMYCGMHSHHRYRKFALTIPLKEIASFREEYGQTAWADTLLMDRCERLINDCGDARLCVIPVKDLFHIMKHATVDTLENSIESYVARINREMENFANDDEIEARVDQKLLTQLNKDARSGKWSDEKYHYKLIGLFLENAEGTQRLDPLAEENEKFEIDPSVIAVGVQTAEEAVKSLSGEKYPLIAEQTRSFANAFLYSEVESIYEGVDPVDRGLEAAKAELLEAILLAEPREDQQENFCHAINNCFYGEDSSILPTVVAFINEYNP